MDRWTCGNAAGYDAAGLALARGAGDDVVVDMIQGVEWGN